MKNLLKMRCFVLLYFIFASKLTLAQTEFSIPVVPSRSSQLHPQTESEKNYNKALQVVDDPALGNVNAARTPVHSSGVEPTVKSLRDVAENIKAAHVDRYGGEGGQVRIRLRGARAFEPSTYFNGLPLSGAASGEQILFLLPYSYFSHLETYPDGAPFWLASTGIAGDINAVPCRREGCFFIDSAALTNRVALNVGVGSFGFRQAVVRDSWQDTPQRSLYATFEATQSNENYPVFNNHNATIGAQNGVFEDLQNNDFKRSGAGFGASFFHPTFGKILFDTVFGAEEKGIPGAVGTVSDVRQQRYALVSTLRNEKLFPESGVRWSNQVGFLESAVGISSYLSLFSAQHTHATNRTVQVKSWVVVPSEIFAQERSGFALDFLHSSLLTDTVIAPNAVVAQRTQTQHERREMRLSLFEGVSHTFAPRRVLSAQATGWLSLVETEEAVVGWSAGVQAELGFLIPYVRTVWSARRPTLSELYGSPGGILSNTILQPERSEKFEVGTKLSMAEVGYFHANDKNLIFLQQVSPISAQYQNLQEGARDGVYASIEMYLLKHWKGEARYQYLIAKMWEQGRSTYVPRTPVHEGELSTALEEIPFFSFQGYEGRVGVYAGMSYSSSFYLDSANVNQMDLPPLYNAGGRVRWQKSATTYVVALDVQNITDEKFANVSNDSGFAFQANTNGYFGFPPPGRRFYVTLTGEF